MYCEMSGEVNMPEITWSSASSKMRSINISNDVPIEDRERLLTVDCQRHFALAMRSTG